MRQADATSEIVLDFLVPANQASRYRARLTSVTAREVQLRLGFRPAIFKRTDLSSCPAKITLVLKGIVVQMSGTFHADAPEGARTGRLRLAEAISAREGEILRGACEPGAAALVRPAGSAEAPPPAASVPARPLASARVAAKHHRSEPLELTFLQLAPV